MNSLDQLGIMHGTDKSSKCHDYLNTYDSLFGDLRDTPIKILELGVAEGRSLRVWEDAFPKAEVTGVDRDLSRIEVPVKFTTRLMEGDVNDLRFLQAVSCYGPWDVIVDDSAHTKDSAGRILSTFWPNSVREGGWLIFEDLHASPEFLDWSKMLVSYVNHFGGLRRNGSAHFGASSKSEIAMLKVVYYPGLACIQRRP